MKINIKKVRSSHRYLYVYIALIYHLMRPTTPLHTIIEYTSVLILKIKNRGISKL